MTYHVVITAFAVLSVLASSAVALYAFENFRRGARRLWEREQRLPEATRYLHLQNLVEDLQKEVDDLQEAKWEALQLIDDANRRKDWMEQTKEEVGKLEKWKKELEEVTDLIETKQVELANCNQDIIAKEKQLVDLTALFNQIDQKKQELETLQSEINLAKEELKHTKSKIREAEKKEIEAVQNEIRQVKEELKLTEKKIREAENQLHAANHKVDGVKRKIDQANQLLSDLEQRRKKLLAEYERLQSENARLAKERNNCEREISSLEGKADGLKEKISGLKGKQASLDSAISTLSSVSGVDDSQSSSEKNAIWLPHLNNFNPAPHTKELEQLDQFGEYLGRKRLRYSQRTRDAFHTAMKVADQSLLVVLAGVSGTGKSLLPQCYAEAFGMHFLNIAVQPRWDGPQDLFGFFDYIDRRFRPTALTRSLLQMDPIGPQKGRGWNPPGGWTKNRQHENMLLVLLDEMNLARVEYYFSEFLSRLETRRSVSNIENAVNRAGAEIELDVGNRREGALKLFVDSNVLFVGTMNEDETTQSLSDKVIDRANVLRFGSPRSLKIDPAQTNGKPVALPNQRLTRKNWQDWQRPYQDLPDVDKEQVAKWVELLRGAMDQARRPFAFRVANGIEEYIANYPEREHRLKYAMSDQIEQKILPKLRGLDPLEPNVQQAFETVRNILNDLDDSTLLKAFEDCSEEQFFAWRGIDRRDGEAVE